jgi:glycerol-3-phosphate dehydrogenase (NAD+)
METILRSCGVADLVATCYGGRNRKCAAEFYTRCQDMHFSEAEGKARKEEVMRLWHEIEEELLNGQKLQGILTCFEVVDYLVTSHIWREEKSCRFPLMRIIYKIITTGKHFDELFHYHHAVHFVHS